MATSQIEVKTGVVEALNESFNTFCADMSGMFGVEMECRQQEVCNETVEGLKKRFDKLIAVSSIKAEGTLDGTFQVIFDQEGLFTLVGVISTHPEQMILENIKSGSLKDAEKMSDAMTEAGNLLVGSWDRAFRKGLEGHGHFAQANVFIGNPWLEPEKKIALANDEKLVFVAYKMTIGPYPAFNCGVIFPKRIFGDLAEAEPEAEEEVETEAGGAAEEKPESKAEDKTDEKAQDQQAAAEKADFEKSDSAQESDGEKSEPQEPAAEKVSAEEIPVKEDEDTERASVTEDKPASAEKPQPADGAKPAEEKPAAKKATDEKESAAQQELEAAAAEEDTDADASAATDVAEEKATAPAGSEEQPVSETIRRMTQSPADLPGEPVPAAAAEDPVVSNAGVPLAVCAKDIMQKNVVWGGPDDTVQHALTKMQQHDAGYIMIGRDGVLEGIVSKSDIAGAVSPYLRPVFAKWRRPLDDATLQIKVRWIMVRPVRTIKPESSVAAIMEDMCRSGGRGLPVMDQQGKIQGLVTVFDIFKTLLNSDPNASTAGKTPEAPPLV